jgi:hypothetical protein
MTERPRPEDGRSAAGEEEGGQHLGSSGASADTARRDRIRAEGPGAEKVDERSTGSSPGSAPPGPAPADRRRPLRLKVGADVKRRLGAALGSPDTSGSADSERHDRTPVAWFARALRVPGSERRSLIQAAKATFAATAAWLLATSVLRLPQPFLAPYAAVFLVEATVYRSVRGWAQQVAAVGAGVLLAATAARLIPGQAVALAVVVFVGLLAGNWRRFGSAGIWVGVTGMLLISYGTATEPVLLGDRLLETALGATIGAAVNALILPPLHGDRLAAATERLAKALAELLGTTSDLVRRDEPPEDLDDLLDQARDVRSLVQVAEEAAGLTREGRMLNLRRRHPASGAYHERPLGTLIALWPPVSQLIAAVRTTSARQNEPFAYPWPDARESLADLIRCLADAVRSVAAAGEPVDLEPCRALLAQLERRLVTAEDDGVPARLGLGTMTLPARHLVEQLENR